MNLIRHNLDVMRIEKNVFENIFNTVMNVDRKTKDNAKSRLDLMEIYRLDRSCVLLMVSFQKLVTH